MPYDEESDLKYISDLDDIPVTGQGIGRNWSQEEKLAAAEDGETKLEADVNEGYTISNPGHIHGEAAATWATYKLVLGMKSPDAQTRGDALDEGSERTSFSEQIREDYFEYVSSITNAKGAESEGGPRNVDFFVADW